jgi:hypothetical protein
MAAFQFDVPGEDGGDRLLFRGGGDSYHSVPGKTQGLQAIILTLPPSVSDSVHQAMKDVRSDELDCDWMVATWDTPTSLKLEGSGSGGLESMKAILPQNDVAYGLLREKFNWESVGDVSADTIKFIFIYWFPDSGVPLMRKMKVGTMEGQVRKLFQQVSIGGRNIPTTIQPFRCYAILTHLRNPPRQYHADIMAGNGGEFTADIVKTLLENITGKADHTTAARAAPKVEKVRMEKYRRQHAQT